jgi:hypothetical protein
VCSRKCVVAPVIKSVWSVGTGRANEKSREADAKHADQTLISRENPVQTTIGSKAALCTAHPRTGEG